MRKVKINNTTSYFISEEGFCTRVKGGREIPIPLLTSGGKPRVKVESQRQNLVHLMVEHFIGDLDINDRISYRVIDGKVPLKYIKVIKFDHQKDPYSDSALIFKFKCDVKARNQNNRVKYNNSISSEDVLNSLKRTNFKCFYCSDPIKSSLWHLDHVVPLCNGGQNISTNITPACKYCNLMKYSLGYDKFLIQCSKIVKNHKIEGGNNG